MIGLLQRYLLLAACAFFICAEVTSAGTSVNFGSTVAATNEKSTGEELTSDFRFQLGTFAGEFQPTATNTDEWLAAWRPASDATGQPLEGSTVNYQKQELGDPFPAGMRAESFSGSVTLQHNEPPFDLGGRLYIWGYDQRTMPGSAEWILVTDPMWVWPDGSSNLPAVNYAVPDASQAILGTINQSGVEMKTAPVTVPGSVVGIYEGWLAQNFSASDLENPSLSSAVWGELADPDADGIANLLEFYTGRDPNLYEPTDLVSQPVIQDGEVHVHFQISPSATGVTGAIEWSDNLQDWSREGLTEALLVEDGSMRVSQNIGDERTLFFRLVARRVAQ